MRYTQSWQLCALDGEHAGVLFPAEVPGNVQRDYGLAFGFGDADYGENYKKWGPTEGFTWEYRTTLDFAAGKDEKVFFVSEGIDYACELLLNGEVLLSHAGMFSRVECELTGAKSGDALAVRILPHPKRAGAPVGRDEADNSVKAPVCYGWDFHPRLLVSGLWDETYIETRTAGFIRDCEAFPRLSDDLLSAVVSFETDCDVPCTVTVYDADGTLIGKTDGNGMLAMLSPRLWWCSGQGEPYLYRYVCRNDECDFTGTFGIRKIELDMNSGSWMEPHGFPKTRSDAPMQLELNGRRVFLKGSNWVAPDMFTGTVDDARYEALIALAKDAHINVFRCWGGSGTAKRRFYELCDRAGIMVWVEFPLACANYRFGGRYIEVLEQEARAIITKLRRRPCVALWCGGNELFNSWSGMTDQSRALRLLNALTLEMDPERPFLMTSPLNGAAHGGYSFDYPDEGTDCFGLFQRSHNTAYTEFGVPGMPDAESLKKVIPPDELFPAGRTPSWIAHHAFEAWTEDSWMGLPTLEKYAAEPLDSLEKLCAASAWLQAEGYKAVFEEARRQSPHCSMAINWCFCEPHLCAANNSLVAYPVSPKGGYYAVKSALRPVLFSARVPRFAWKAGETFTAEIWFLNDTFAAAAGDAKVWLEIGDRKLDLLTWSCEADRNTIGPSVNLVLPDVDAKKMTLHIDAGEYSSAYTLAYTKMPEIEKYYRRLLNL